MEQATIREAVNSVKLAGVLKEKSLEIKTGDKGKYISGYLIIQTDANSAHRVNMFANEKTKDGKDSGIFTSTNTIKNEYISLADCATNGWDESRATRVVVTNGRLGLNEYYGEDGTLHSGWSVTATFVNSIKTGGPVDFCANFEVEGFINAVREKDDKVFVDLIVPVYGGRVVPITFSVAPAVADFVLNNYNRGDSTMFAGSLVNMAEKEVKRKEGFGGVQEEITIKYVRALVISNGNPSAYDPDDDNTKAWDSKAIKVALTEREAYLETLKAKGNKPKTSTATTSKKAQEFDF